MINNKKKTKLKFITAMVAFFMIFSAISTLLISLKSINKKLFAYSSEVTVSNPNFANPTISTNTTLPATASDWSKQNDNNDLISGIISLDSEIATEDKIKNSYKLDSNNFVGEYTGMADKQVLMINAQDALASAGYTSSSIKMQKSSYYVIQFMAYTQTTAHASAKLSGDDELENQVLTITTDGQWQQYRIYVATSNINSLSTSLELWLGAEGKSKSVGAVFFDNVKITEYDNNTFMKAYLDETKNTMLVNLQDRYVSYIQNASFENPISDADWHLMDNSMVGTNNTINGVFSVEYFNADDTKVYDEIKNTNVYGNKNALLINNIESGFVGYESSHFTAEKNKLYKLSFLVKSNISSGSATVNVVERNPYSNKFLSDEVTANPYYYENSSYEAQTFTMESVTSSGTNEQQNGWTVKSFYIKGNPLVDTELKLQLMLGSESTGAKGYILFDNFTLEEITSSEYTANVSDGTEVNLNQYKTESKFTNGSFNLVTIEAVNDNYPYLPESWTISTKNKNGSVLNGVINTNENNTALGIPSITAKNSYKNNNVLMIGNISSNNQKYTSQSVTFSADGYAKITFDVLTYDLSVAKAGLRVKSDNNILGEVLNIDTNGEWKTYTIMLKNSYEDKTIFVELSLGENAEGTGYAFFDNVKFETVEQDVYTEDTENKKIDLSTYDFANIPTNSTETQGVYAPYNFTTKNAGGKNDGTITSGVIDTTKYGTNEGYNESSFENPGHPEGENSNVLMIKSTEDVYYLYSTVMSSNIKSGNYYQIDVKVKTQNLGQDTENKKYYDKNSTKAYPYGASINVNGIDAKFTGIDTNGEWKTYTIYINATTDNSINLELSLGSENALTKGVAYFSTAKIQKIDETAYVNGIKVLESDETIENVLAIGNTDIKTEPEETNETTGEVEFNWLVVPSLVFGLAIIFAVVMVIVRNTKRSHKKAKIKEQYSKDEFKRLADSHKVTLEEISKSKRQAVKKQNQVAERLNEEKLKDTEKAKENVVKLQNEFNKLEAKIAELDEAKKQENKSYKQAVDALKDMKKNTENLKKRK